MIELILAKLAEKTTRYTAIALATIMLLLATYLQGRSDGKNVMKAQMLEDSIRWQAEVAAAQGYYQDNIADLVAQYTDQIRDLKAHLQYMENNPEIVKVYIPASVDAFVPQGFINLHNDAAAGRQLNAMQPNAGQMTKKKLSDVGTVIATNYYECNSTRLQLITLQNVIREYQKTQAGLK